MAGLLLLCGSALTACAADGPGDEPAEVEEEVVDSTTEPLSWPWGGSGNAVGLALEVNDGVGAPLTLRAGQRFYINQIDIRTENLGVTADQGVASLDLIGDFANLDWRGVSLRDTSFAGQNMDGTFTRRRFYRDAPWMERSSQILLWQVDSNGRLLDLPAIVNIGRDDRGAIWDDFFVRRLRAIQWTYDCGGPQNCDGAQNFSEEALLEVRHSRHPERTFKIHPRASAFKLMWTLQGGRSYTIPVTQQAAPTYAYGFQMDVKPITPPRSNGTYAPGTNLEFQITLRDGEGKRLHPEGSLPTFNQVMFGTATAETGITYWNGFAERVVTYYRRKHKERMFASMIIGPAQDVKPIRSYLELEDFVGGPVFETSNYDTEGVFSRARGFPAFNEIFTNQWDIPQSDRFTFQLPNDARSGTYYITTKARRVYQGEDTPVTSQVKIQVGSPTPTQSPSTVGNCASCHKNGGELSNIAHANTNLATCNPCHAPLFNEADNPVYVRLHFIHSRSDRFDAPLKQCNLCHLDRASIQRTSKSACLSCHKSYPASHVAQFGPITDSYVGGGRESFQQCSQTCHTNHPGSLL